MCELEEIWKILFVRIVKNLFRLMNSREWMKAWKVQFFHAKNACKNQALGAVGALFVKFFSSTTEPTGLRVAAAHSSLGV